MSAASVRRNRYAAGVSDDAEGRPEGLRFLSGIILVSAEPARLVADHLKTHRAAGGDLVAHWSGRA